jgi:NADPH:quinone reductase-like Zn-dependent oxidoreductase
MQEDVTRGGERFDVIAGVNGSHSVLTYRRMLAPHGIFVGLGGSLAPLLAGLLAGPVLSRLGDRKVGAMAARVNGDDLSTLRGMLESGRIVPVIVRRYPLAEAQAAIQYLLQGHAAGKVVITIDR